MYTVIMFAEVEYNNNKTGGLDTFCQTPVDFSFRSPGSLCNGEFCGH
jgi:hypothetical protein